MNNVDINKNMPLAVIIAATSCLSSAALAQTPAPAPAPARSALLSSLSQCRSLSSDADRLACYDRAAAALDQGERSGELVVIEKAQVQAAKRDLFGFSMPSLPNLFGKESEEDRVTSIETTLTSAGQSPDGKWVFRLGDQSEWRQIDSMPVRFRNRPGEEVRVRNAALGSYLLTVGSSRAVRVRRQ